MIYKAENGQTLKALDVDHKECIEGVYEVDTDNGIVYFTDKNSKESVVRYRLILVVEKANPIEFHCNCKIDEEDEAAKNTARIYMKKYNAFRSVGFSESASLELCCK